MSNFFAKIIVQTFAVVGKSVFQAYQQVVTNGKSSGTQNAVRTSRRLMRPDEALRVLNIDSSALTRQSLNQQYDKYFNSNDPKKGGSFYLQSKIYRAKESLDFELQDKQKTNGNSSRNNNNSNSSNNSNTTPTPEESKKQ